MSSQQLGWRRKWSLCVGTRLCTTISTCDLQNSDKTDIGRDVLIVHSFFLWSQRFSHVLSSESDLHCSLQLGYDLLVGDRSARLVVIHHLWLLIHPLHIVISDDNDSSHPSFTPHPRDLGPLTVASSFCVQPLLVLACCNARPKSSVTRSSAVASV